MGRLRDPLAVPLSADILASSASTTGKNKRKTDSHPITLDRYQMLQALDSHAECHRMQRNYTIGGCMETSILSSNSWSLSTLRQSKESSWIYRTESPHRVVVQSISCLPVLSRVSVGRPFQSRPRNQVVWSFRLDANFQVEGNETRKCHCCAC